MCFTLTDNRPSSDVTSTPPPPRHRSVTFSDAAMLTTEKKSLGTSVLQRKQNTTLTQHHKLKKANISTTTSDRKPKIFLKPTHIDLNECQHSEKIFQDRGGLLVTGKQRSRQPHSPFPTKEQLAAVKSVGTPGMSCNNSPPL